MLEFSLVSAENSSKLEKLANAFVVSEHDPQGPDWVSFENIFIADSSRVTLIEEVSQLYDGYVSNGLVHGPSWKIVEKISRERNLNVVLSKLRLPKKYSWSESSIPPSLIDATFQSTGRLLKEVSSFWLRSENTLQEMQSSDCFYSHCSVRYETTKETILDCTVLTMEGQSVMRFEGVRLTPINSLIGPALVYDCWEEDDISSAPHNCAATDANTCFVIGGVSFCSLFEEIWLSIFHEEVEVCLFPSPDQLQQYHFSGSRSHYKSIVVSVEYDIFVEHKSELTYEWPLVARSIRIEFLLLLIEQLSNSCSRIIFATQSHLVAPIAALIRSAQMEYPGIEMLTIVVDCPTLKRRCYHQQFIQLFAKYGNGTQSQKLNM